MGNSLELGCSFLHQKKEETDAVLLTNVSRRAAAGKKSGTESPDDVSGKVYSLDKVSDIQKLPGCMRGMIVMTSAVQGKSFDRDYGVCTAEAFWCQILLQKKRAAVVNNGWFSGCAAISDVDEMRTDWERRDWYLDVVEQYCLPLFERFREKDSVPLFVQAQVLFALKVAFRVNMENKNKGVLKGEDLKRYLNGCRDCLKKISNKLISTAESVHPERKLVYDQWSAFMCLKYEREQDGLFIRGDRPRLYCTAPSVDQSEGLLPFVTVDLMEAEHGIWRLDCSVEHFLVEEPLALEVRLNGKAIPIRNTDRFSQVSFFGWPVVKKIPFAVEIPVDLLKAQNRVEFLLTDDKGNRMMLPPVALDYEAKVTSLFKNAYWCFGKYMVTMEHQAGQTAAILICAAGRMRRMKQELRFMKEILTASYGSRQMFLVRGMYWLVYPLWSRKKIWITFDKLYKGGDCGEYFYRYMVSRGAGSRPSGGRNADGIIPVYVINSNAADRKRLEQEGYHPLVYRSLKQRLAYLYSDVVFGTHSSVHSFCGFSKWEIRFVQDRLRSINTCIQHGLSVQDLTFDSNRIVNNNKRYYCASRYEVENLSRPAYDYGEDVLRLTGIPRYDGLVNRDQRQILITPTWRAYIAMPSAMGSSRPYNPDFKNTDYYKIFQQLLENRHLAETAKQTGYRIIYLLHPVISSQKEDFHPGAGIELVTAMDISYEKILTESSLMVTDYSGVQFDFAYMRKPVVYYHTPKLPPHYEEGGFFYDTQGFGEICTGHQELVDTLCDYMEHDCQLKPFYREREDDFFAFDDHNNCQRIFEDALEYQKKRQKEEE